MKSRGVVLSHKRGSGSSAMLREIVVDHGKLSLLPHDQVETARLPQRTIARPGQANVFLPPAEGGVRAAGQARLCGAGGCAPTGFPRGSKGAAFHAPFPAFPVPCARGWYFFQKRTPPLSGRRESKKDAPGFPDAPHSIHSAAKHKAEAGVECEPRGFPFLRRTSSGSPLLHVPSRLSRCLYRPHHSMGFPLCQPARLFPLISHCRANRVDLNECLDVIGTVQSAEDEFFSKIIEADLQAVKKAMTERRLAALRSILNAKQYRRIWMYCAEEKSVTEIR